MAIGFRESPTTSHLLTPAPGSPVSGSLDATAERHPVARLVLGLLKGLRVEANQIGARGHRRQRQPAP
jgi:hypothetical protein